MGKHVLLWRVAASDWTWMESDERQIQYETQGGQSDIVQRIAVKDNTNKEPQLLCSASGYYFKGVIYHFVLCFIYTFVL